MRYGYLKDPLFLFCLLLYGVNRWILKPYVPNGFSQNFLNDLICIPFWVPIMLLLMVPSAATPAVMTAAAPAVMPSASA